MALFDLKNFNAEVFGKYVDMAPNLNRNELLKSKAVVQKQQYASMLPDQTGGNYIVIPIKARIGGTPDNYDGSTDITADTRATYSHGRIVVGRAHGWTEKDFYSDITGDDFEPAANEVAEYWDDVDQATLLSTLAGIFSMTGSENLKFVDGHTYDVTEELEKNVFDATTLNNGIQKALGDNKSKFALAIMHSQVATNIENLKLTDYLRYTDKDGITRTVSAGTLNGRMILVDDNMPAEVAGDFTKYTTYVLGEGAIEYTNCGAKVPTEMDRNPARNGGETTLYSRQRKIFSPVGISWNNDKGIISPTNEQLEDGSNWELANSNADGTIAAYPHKAIPIARIISRG
ncbi:MAG: phage coat protein [Oscillospiraceae bacterium]|nr:phage coat protein [Oscillospiraceae bacterium]